MDICGLCVQQRELVRSHQVPKALIRLCTKDSAGDPNPLVALGAKVHSVGAQTRAEFLCSECENLLSQKGESFVVRSCLRGEADFPLLTRLLAATPRDDDGTVKIYDGAEVLGHKNFEALIYFGASMFWRTLAGPWRAFGKPHGTGSIAPRQEEALRRYLLGKQAFPSEEATILVAVSSDVDNPGTRCVAGPISDHKDDYILHGFYARGLEFTFYTGDLIPLVLKQIASTGPLHPIYVQPFGDSDLHRLLWDGLRISKPTASVAKKMKTLREKRGRL